MELHLKQNITYNATWLNGVLRPKLLNIQPAFCFLINFDFLLPHIAHFDIIIVLSFLVLKTLGFMFSAFFLHFKQCEITLFYIWDFKLLLIN